MSENAPASTPFYKNPMIMGGVVFVIVVIIVIVVFARSGGSDTPLVLVPTPSPSVVLTKSPSVASPVAASPVAASPVAASPAAAAPAAVTAASCKSFVDAKTCPPASAASCRSFVTAEATRVTGMHNEPWCKSTYGNLRTVSPFCIKVRNEMNYANAAIRTVFSRPNVNYLKRTTKTSTSTSSSETIEFFMIEEAGLAINSIAVADAKSTRANKYMVPASGVNLYTKEVTTTPTNFPKFDTDIKKLNDDIRAKSASIVPTMWRRAMTNETSMSLVKAMYVPAVWTQIYQSTDKTKTYYRLNSDALAKEFIKITKALPDSDYNVYCGTD
jgi:hypothetical protein